MKNLRYILYIALLAYTCNAALINSSEREEKSWGNKAKEIVKDAIDTAIFGVVAGRGTGWGAVPCVGAGLMGIQIIKYMLKQLKTDKDMRAFLRASLPRNHIAYEKSPEKARWRLMNAGFASMVFNLDLEKENKNVKYLGTALGILVWLFSGWVGGIVMRNFYSLVKAGVFVGSLYGVAKILDAVLPWPFTNGFVFTGTYVFVAYRIAWYMYFRTEKTAPDTTQDEVQQMEERLNVTQKKEEKNKSVFVPSEPATTQGSTGYKTRTSTTNKRKAKRDTKAKGFFWFAFFIAFLGLLVFARKTARRRKRKRKE